MRTNHGPAQTLPHARRVGKELLLPLFVRNLQSRSTNGFFDGTASVTLDGVDRPLTLRRYGDHPDLGRRTDTFDPFAVALLVPAMLRGEPLVIEGGIDEMLLDALRGPVQHTLRLMAPGWRHVAIEADARPAPLVTDWTRGAATAMSGGIDSIHLARHRILDPAVPEPLRAKLLVHHHVGAHGDDERVFEEQFTHARRFDDRLCGDLLVCIRGFRRDRAAINCGRCYKCARVLLQAEADGRFDAVAPTFDVAGYRRGMSHSILRLLRWSLGFSRNVNEIDLLKHLHARRYPFPAWTRPGVALALLLHGTTPSGHPLP